jgi:ethanolamine utilization protein EutP (predicted NTPase)
MSKPTLQPCEDCGQLCREFSTSDEHAVECYHGGRSDSPATYTHQDIVRAVLAQQWAVAIAVVMCAKPKPSYLSAVLASPVHFPCAIDVVAELEKICQR